MKIFETKIFRVKERERSYRSKYQDPEKSIRRRKQSDRTESGDLSSSSHESYVHSSGISVGGAGDYYIRTISSNDDYQASGKTRSSSMDSNASSDVFETTNRRLSSPLTSHSAGVVTASLKIPVQVQSNSTIQTSSSTSNLPSSTTFGQNIQVYIQEKSKQSFNIGDNYTDIPFIEDSGGHLDCSEECKNFFSFIPSFCMLVRKSF